MAKNNERRRKKSKKEKKQRNKCNFGVRRIHFDFIIKLKVLQSFSHFFICDYNFEKLMIIVFASYIYMMVDNLLMYLI